MSASTTSTMPLWVRRVFSEPLRIGETELPENVLLLAKIVAPWPFDSKRIESMAVLPLENLSHDPAQDYFADGMTDELITTLAKVGALRVISRTSVMQYKETKKSIPQIARELNVDAVLEGTVMREEDRVRITVQLIRATPERQSLG